MVVSAPFKRDGWYLDIIAAMEQMGGGAAERLKQTPLYRMYVNQRSDRQIGPCWSPRSANWSGRTTTGRKSYLQ